MSLTAYGEGGYFNLHCDAVWVPDPTNSANAIYYLHRRPRGFEGGQLRIHDTLVGDSRPQRAKTFQMVEPVHDSIVFSLHRLPRSDVTGVPGQAVRRLAVQREHLRLPCIVDGWATLLQSGPAMNGPGRGGHLRFMPTLRSHLAARTTPPVGTRATDTWVRTQATGRTPWVPGEFRIVPSPPRRRRGAACPERHPRRGTGWKEYRALRVSSRSAARELRTVIPLGRTRRHVRCRRRSAGCRWCRHVRRSGWRAIPSRPG
ncbi:2OG-Fe(II) oxygenase [Streptomyces sp. NPDC031705]|uniref:2OG-Fe(II) oxygenase n=1 Tax=Streptomyces sp. NPDC031705 TaxID=3155729 RepID=UPI0033E7DB53